MVSDLIASMTGLVTVILALLLFNKFGVEAHLVEKRFKLVSDLLTEIASKRYTLRLLSRRTKYPNIHFFHPRYSGAFRENNKIDEHVLVGRSYVNGITKIEELAKDFFMPQEITTKLTPLLVSHISQVKGLTANEYYEQGYYYIEDDSSQSKPENDDMIGVLNGEEMTVDEFAQAWEEIVLAAVAWINKNSSIKAAIRPK